MSFMVFTALDFETTGLYPAKDRIIEIGALQYMLPELALVKSMEQLVFPGIPINPEASAVNGIKDSMLAGCPPMEDVIGALYEFIGSSIVVAHNAGFDIGFLKAESERAGLDWKPMKVLDTRVLTQKCFPGLPSYSLQNLKKNFGIFTEKAHRAYDDADACMQLLKKCIKQNGLNFAAGFIKEK